MISLLYESYASGRISRREFMNRAAALGVAGVAAAALDPLVASPADASTLAQAALAELSAAKTLPLDLAEWSFMWVNVKRADTARGSFIGGQQMYVEYMIPARVRKPFPIVLVHGGGGHPQVGAEVRVGTAALLLEDREDPGVVVAQRDVLGQVSRSIRRYGCKAFVS